MNKYEAAREIYAKQNKIEVFDKAFEDLCNLVIRQTDYNKEDAKQKLIENDMNVKNVIRNWMGISSEKPKQNKSTNQMVFSEFRKFLTDASMDYHKKQELKKNFEKEAAKELERRKKLEENDEQKNEEKNDEEVDVIQL